MSRRSGRDRFRTRELRDVRGVWPTRGVDLPYQPRAFRNVGDPVDDEIACRHGAPWMSCAMCSTRRVRS